MSIIKNNNTKPLKKMALKSLRQHPFRSFAIALSIFLCSAVMMAVPLTNTLSFLGIYEDVKNEEHVTYTELNQLQISQLQKDARLEAALISRQSSIGQVGNTYARLAYAQEGNEAMEIYTLTKGTYPQNTLDAAVDEALAQRLHIGIGDTITYKSSGKGSASFTICGLVRTNILTSVSRIYVSEQYSRTGAVFIGTPFCLQAKLTKSLQKNSSTAEQTILDIADDCSIPSRNIAINTISLYTNPISSSQVFFYVFVDGVCLVASILVIYSIFYISVLSRISEFGQMSTLGVSQRQISRMVRYEGIFLSVIGITLGLAAGILISWAIIGIFSIKYALIFGIAVFAINNCVIMLCLQKPVRIASACTPIEALRHNDLSAGESLGNRSAAKHTSALRHRTFCPWTLACIHFKAQRKKSFFTILSMLMGGILFLLGSTYIVSVDTEHLARQSYFSNAEYMIGYDSEYQDIGSETEIFEYQEQNILNDKFIQELYNIPQVSSVTAYSYESVTYTYDGYTVNNDMVMLSDTMLSEINKDLGENAVDEETLARENGVIYNMRPAFWDMPIAVGDIVTLNYFNGQAYTSIDVKIAAITSEDYAVDHFLQSGFLAPRALMEKMYPGLNTTRYLLVTTKNHVYNSSIDSAIKNVVNNYDLISLSTFSDSKKELLRQNNLLNAMIGGGAAIIILFCIINIFNTTLSAMASRNRNLALLESAGMSSRQIRQMLVDECLLLSVPAAAIAAILGTFLGKFAVTVLHSSGVSYISWHFPWAALMIYMIIAIGLPIAITLGTNRRFCRHTLTDRLKMME